MERKSQTTTLSHCRNTKDVVKRVLFATMKDVHGCPRASSQAELLILTLTEVLLRARNCTQDLIWFPSWTVRDANATRSKSFSAGKGN